MGRSVQLVSFRQIERTDVATTCVVKEVNAWWVRLGSKRLAANYQPFGRGQNRLPEVGFSWCLQKHCGSGT